MPYLFGVGSVKVAPEKVKFGTKSAIAPAYLETVGPPTWDLKAEYHENPALLQGLSKEVAGVIGVKSGSTVSFPVELRGYDTGTVEDEPTLAEDADVTPDMRCVAAGLGGIYAGGYDGTGIDGDTSTATNLVLTDASDFVDGQIIVCDGEATLVLESTTTTSEELALGIPLSAIPVAGKKIYGTINVYNIAGYNADYADSLSIERLRQAATDYTVCTGARPTAMKFGAEPGGFLTADFTFGMQAWVREDTGGAPTGLTYDYPAKVPWAGGKCVVYDITSETRTELTCGKVEIDTGMEVSGQRDANATGGVAEWDKTKLQPTITINPLQGTETTAAGWNFEFETGHEYAIMIQTGTTAGAINGICIPACVQMQTPGDEDLESKLAKALMFKTIGNDRSSAVTSDDYDDANPADKEIIVFWG